MQGGTERNREKKKERERKEKEKYRERNTDRNVYMERIKTSGVEYEKNEGCEAKTNHDEINKENSR